MLARQLWAACFKSALDISIWTSFSASENVAGETGGPTCGAVPNAGGAPGGSSAGFWELERQPAVAASTARELRFRNCLRELDMAPPRQALEPRRRSDSIRTSDGNPRGRRLWAGLSPI